MVLNAKTQMGLMVGLFPFKGNYLVVLYYFSSPLGPPHSSFTFALSPPLQARISKIKAYFTHIKV